MSAVVYFGVTFDPQPETRSTLTVYENRVFTSRDVLVRKRWRNHVNTSWLICNHIKGDKMGATCSRKVGHEKDIQHFSLKTKDGTGRRGH